jgi:hypothetical protein
MAESLVKFSRKWVSSDCYWSGVTVKCFMLPEPSVWFGLVWFGLVWFVCSSIQSHM